MGYSYDATRFKLKTGIRNMLSFFIAVTFYTSSYRRILTLFEGSVNRLSKEHTIHWNFTFFCIVANTLWKSLPSVRISISSKINFDCWQQSEDEWLILISSQQAQQTATALFTKRNIIHFGAYILISSEVPLDKKLYMATFRADTDKTRPP